ncbi:MAG: tetratricopeptide repeat protein [Kiritimatiellae bacterium]|nr:tetratricopeptide repeat protein [Kiritimatiellia bacterium]
MNAFHKIYTALLLLCWSGALLASPLEVAEEALSDSLYRVAQTNAVLALRDETSMDGQQRALLILLEALAHQKRYDEMLQTLEQNQALVGAAKSVDALLYWRVLALFNQQRFDDVARIVNSAQVNSNSVYGVTMMRIGARSRGQAGDLSGALALFARVDQSTTSLNLRASNALEWAVMLDREGSYDEALRVLKMLAQYGITGEAVNEGALLRGRILMKQGKMEEATLVMDALAMNDRVAEIPRVQAQVEMSVYKFERGLTNEAIAYARSAYERAQLPATRKLAGYRLGDLLTLDPATLEEGSRLIKALVREFPEDAESMQAHLKLADSLLQMKETAAAAAEYRILLETYPASSLDGRVMQGRGWALFQLGRYTEAGVAFAKAAELADDNAVKAECLFKRCDALLADKRYGEAAAAYKELTDRFPDSKYAGQALFQSADALERAGNLTEAGVRYSEVAARYPHRDVAPDALLRVAALQSAARELAAAIETYSLVIESFTNANLMAQAYMGRGKVYYSKYEFKNAMQDFAAVAEVAPARLDEARYYLTLTLYGLGRDSDALDSANEFVINFPNSQYFPEMLLWLGKFNFNRLDYAAARKYFDEFAVGFPERKWAGTALLWEARAMFNSGDFTAAVETIARLVKLYPESPQIAEARFVQADALIELARFDAAILLLDGILAKAPESKWGRLALLRKGNCLFALGAGNRLRYEEALAAYRKMAQETGLPSALLIELYYKIGRCLEKLERFDEAVECYYTEVLLRYLQESAAGAWYDETTLSLVVRAAFSAAEIFEKQGEYKKAVSMLQRIVTSGGLASDEALRRIEVLKKLRGFKEL